MEFIDLVKESVRDHVINCMDSEGRLTPVLMLKDSEGANRLFLTVATTSLDDDAAYHSALASCITTYLVVYEAVEAAFASLSWNAPDLDLSNQPSAHPNRQLVMMVIHGYPDGGTAWMADVVSEEDSTSLGEWSELDMDTEYILSMAINRGLCLSTILSEEVHAKLRKLPDVVYPIIGQALAQIQI
jgi:hypothetical protein